MFDGIRAAVLDTHVWVWMAAGVSRAGALADFRGRCLIPAISVWEVAMRANRGRLRLEPTPARWVQKNLRSPAQLERLSTAIALESAALEEFQGDPADRLIVATAVVLGVPLITADAAICRWNETKRAIQLFPL